MWKLGILPGLLVVSRCLAAPQTGASSSHIDNLIESIFSPFAEKGITTTAAPEPGSLAYLIEEALREQEKNDREIQNSKSKSPTNAGVDNSNHFAVSDDCECVPHYQCHANGTISTNGLTLIDIRAAGPCESSLDVCCKPPDRISADNKTTPRPKPRNGCGYRNHEGVGFRITGNNSNEAQFGEFPWMVAVLRKEYVNPNDPKQSSEAYLCGGSLIHPQAVLTAAHYIKGKKPHELKVRAGEWDTQTSNEIYPHQDRDVVKIIVHERYDSGTLYNDFAILILSRSFDLAENVNVVCLPNLEDQFDLSRCFATGWGKDVFGLAGRPQVILKRIELPMVPHDDCQTALRRTRLGRWFVLHSSFVCAGGEAGHDTCRGDGGGPLVCPINNNPTRFAQVGIVAWGIGCGEAAVPGVYANVAGARRWIDEKMAYNDLNTFTYTYAQ